VPPKLDLSMDKQIEEPGKLRNTLLIEDGTD
jgi:hypothetical protein